MTRPPVTRLSGLSPSQDAKCLALGHFVMSVPISPITFRAVKPSTPSIRVRSTPVIRYRWVLMSKRGRVALTAPPTVGGRRPAVALVLEPLQVDFNLPVAPGNLILIEPVQLQGLGQLEDVFLPPVPLQRPGDGVVVRFHARATKLGQLAGVPFAVHDGLDNVHPGLAGDVADDVLELDVHLGQRLLHVLDMVGSVLHQHGPMPQVAAQTPDVRVWPEGSRQQSVGVQLLQPLAVQHVGLAPRHVLDATCGSTSITSNPRSSSTPNRGIQYTPVDSMTTVSTPHWANQSANRYRSAVKAANSSHRRLRAAGGHRHEMAGGPHVDARRVQVYLGQLRGQTLPPPPQSGSPAVAPPLACRHHLSPPASQRKRIAGGSHGP